MFPSPIFSFPILTTDATGLMMIFPFFHTSFTSSRAIDDICFWRLFWQRLKYIYSAANICIAVTIMQNIIIAHMFWCVKSVSLPKWRCSTYFQCTHIFGVSNIFLWREPVIFLYRSIFFCEHIFLNEMLWNFENVFLPWCFYLTDRDPRLCMRMWAWSADSGAYNTDRVDLCH